MTDTELGIGRQRGLREAVAIAWDRKVSSFSPSEKLGPPGIFGAASRSLQEFFPRGGRRPESFDTLESATPESRLLGTGIGRTSARITGDVTLALAALDRISVEVIGEALRCGLIRGPRGQLRPFLPRILSQQRATQHDRFLVMPRTDRQSPILLVLSRQLASINESRFISDELEFTVPALLRALETITDPNVDAPEVAIVREMLDIGARSLADAFFVSRPEVVLTRHPKMVPLCVPVPHVRIDAGTRISTAGIFCRDTDGELGVTGCRHGTGPVGTQVQVDLRASVVKRASEVQDLVFIPLGDGFNVPPLAGLGKVLRDREPARADRVHFSGVVNQNRTTRVMSTDQGMLRQRPTVQLRLQTDPDTDQGDSGSALLDEQDRVIGFAFERTAYEDYPQFTDWIWAANALRALELTPYGGEE